jgi:hypothetical protein
MKDLTLLIGTCDSYSPLWDNFVTLCDRYWQPDCKKIFVSENNSKTYLGYDWLKPGNLPWSDRILYAVNSIETKYTMFVLEDYYFTETISNEEIEMYLAFMESLSANKVMLEYRCPHLRLVPYGVATNGMEICKLAPNSKYLASIQPSIWNTSYLKSCLRPNWGPWEFEDYASSLINGNTHETYIFIRDKKPYWNAVRQGMRLSAGWEQLKLKEQLSDLNI